jgi:hypothetical protein
VVVGTFPDGQSALNLVAARFSEVIHLTPEAASARYFADRQDGRSAPKVHVTAMIFWLKNRRRAQWRDVQKVDRHRPYRDKCSLRMSPPCRPKAVM